MDEKKFIKIDIEVSDLAGYMFHVEGKQLQFEDMTREQQIRVLNSLTQGYNLFVKFLKDE